MKGSRWRRMCKGCPVILLVLLCESTDGRTKSLPLSSSINAWAISKGFVFYFQNTESRSPRSVVLAQSAGKSCGLCPQDASGGARLAETAHPCLPSGSAIIPPQHWGDCWGTSKSLPAHLKAFRHFQLHTMMETA